MTRSASNQDVLYEGWAPEAVNTDPKSALVQFCQRACRRAVTREDVVYVSTLNELLFRSVVIFFASKADIGCSRAVLAPSGKILNMRWLGRDVNTLKLDFFFHFLGTGDFAMFRDFGSLHPHCVPWCALGKPDCSIINLQISRVETLYSFFPSASWTGGRRTVFQRCVNLKRWHFCFLGCFTSGLRCDEFWLSRLCERRMVRWLPMLNHGHCPWLGRRQLWCSRDDSGRLLPLIDRRDSSEESRRHQAWTGRCEVWSSLADRGTVLLLLRRRTHSRAREPWTRERLCPSTSNMLWHAQGHERLVRRLPERRGRLRPQAAPSASTFQPNLCFHPPIPQWLWRVGPSATPDVSPC